ncbi:GNAT family N-acetyltransferase [Pseudotabrizicola sp. 4114]|uniref:GNAT family N-acetyltransferase n=1 Tax=Pseudotabrizicola sp. 4114 TaxID=2817731 RepID=UPI002863AA30|nr:RimJ/RimL family protein N-acetyltransferase [Pseudorhodobacter sp. 4114]
MPWSAPLTPQMQAEAARHGAVLPVLHTARLTLRAPRLSDFDAYRAIACSDRGQYFGGPMPVADAWDDFARMTAIWLLRGHGVWTVEAKPAVVAGFVLIGFEPGDLEPELGFMFLPGFEGKGLAFEAASAARDHAFAALGLTTLVSYIDPANLRAQSLAARMGAVSEGEIDGSQVWRHVRRSE